MSAVKTDCHKTDSTATCRYLARRLSSLAAAGLFSLIVIVLVGLSIWSLYRGEVDAWRGRGVIFSRMLASHAQQVLTSATNLTRTVTQDVHEADIKSSAQLVARFGTASYMTGLRQEKSNWGDIFEIGLVDAEGKLFSATDLKPGMSLDLGARSYFKECRDGRDADGTYLGAPALNKATNRWHFTLCRKILNREGAFIGAALVAIDSDYFESFYRIDGEVGQRRAVLLRQDGTILAGDLFGAHYGDRIESPSFLRATKHEISGAWQSVATSPFEAAQAGLLFARSVPNFPVVSALIYPTPVILAKWWSSAFTLAVLAALLIGLAAALATWSRHAEQLQRRLMTAEITSRDARSEAQRAKLEFVSLVSHDLRTPLTSMIAGAELLDRELEPATRCQYARMIRTSAEHTLSLVDSILNFATTELKPAALRDRPFSIRELVADCILIAQGNIADRDLVMETQIADDVPGIVKGDPGVCRQILSNLLSNAIKYTSSGTVTVRVVRAMSPNDSLRIRLSVIDTGQGIPEATRRALFEPFVRGAATGSRLTEGHGLGLSIVQRFVKALDGDVEITSTPGVGTIASVEIPFKAEERLAQGGSIEAALAPATAKPLDILLAEDTESAGLLIKSLLERLDHRVVLVHNGVEAVKATLQTQFDLILMDIRMPEMNGVEAARQIGAEGKSRSSPIIALTGFSEEAVVKLFDGRRFAAHLQKPVRLDDLRAVIQRAISAGENADPPAPATDLDEAPEDSGSI